MFQSNLNPVFFTLSDVTDAASIMPPYDVRRTQEVHVHLYISEQSNGNETFF